MKMDKIYEDFTMEKLQEILLEMVEGDTPNVEPSRRMKIVAGQLGIIQYYEVLFDRKLTKEELDKIPEGAYTITNDGVIYHGQGLRNQLEDE